LWAALRDGADLLDRCQIPGFLLGDASRNAWDGTDLSGDKIVFGIKSGEYTDLTKSTIRSMRPGAILEENEARYLTNGVPVIIKVIRRKYEFLQNLDKKWYKYDEYLFANPFEKYYKARYIVQ